jgi:aminoglycoside phosphotransferase (APT) family kinase protein
MHADVDVTVDLASELLRAQHPDLAGLPLRVEAFGWDNVVLRLGRDLALRLPRREAAAHLVAHEQDWLPVLAPRLPVPVPLPVRTGHPEPDLGYPYRWSVVPWFAGETVARTDVAGRAAWAGRLGETLAALHLPAPADAPVNPVRGVPLGSRGAAFAERLAPLEPGVADRLRGVWREGVDAPGFDGPPVWLHGDPHPGNLVARVGPDGQQLAAVVDFGDVTSGDPASDLATAWLTFDAAGRTAFREVVDAASGWDEATWVRARGWAAHLTSVLLAHPREHPLMASVGRHALAQLVGPA